MYTMLWSCFWIFVVLTSSVKCAIVWRDFKCAELDGDYNCIEIKECPNIYQLVSLAPSPPLPKDVLEIIRKHHCGFKGKDPLVCCSYKMKQILELSDPQFPVPPPAEPEVSKNEILYNMFLIEDFVIESYLDELFP